MGCHHTESLIFFERYVQNLNGKIVSFGRFGTLYVSHTCFMCHIPPKDTVVWNVTMKFHQHFMTTKRGYAIK